MSRRSGSWRSPSLGGQYGLGLKTLGEPPHQGWACVSFRVTQRPTSVAVDTEAALGFLLWESWRKGGTTTNLPEGLLAPAQLALAALIETTEAAGPAGSRRGVRTGRAAFRRGGCNKTRVFPAGGWWGSGWEKRGRGRRKLLTSTLSASKEGTPI